MHPVLSSAAEDGSQGAICPSSAPRGAAGGWGSPQQMEFCSAEVRKKPSGLSTNYKWQPASSLALKLEDTWAGWVGPMAGLSSSDCCWCPSSTNPAPVWFLQCWRSNCRWNVLPYFSGLSGSITHRLEWRPSLTGSSFQRRLPRRRLPFVLVGIPSTFPFRFPDWVHSKLHIRLSDRGVLQDSSEGNACEMGFSANYWRREKKEEECSLCITEKLRGMIDWREF